MNHAIKNHFAEKLKDLAVQVFTILVDNLLLALWVVVEYCVPALWRDS